MELGNLDINSNGDIKSIKAFGPKRGFERLYFEFFIITHKEIRKIAIVDRYSGKDLIKLNHSNDNKAIPKKK
jgi:hypothetical protein